jgi:hypothetical protein
MQCFNKPNLALCAYERERERDRERVPSASANLVGGLVRLLLRKNDTGQGGIIAGFLVILVEIVGAR